jgi:hypothetical protein
MKHGIRETVDVQHSTPSASTSQADEALRRVTAQPAPTFNVREVLAHRAGRMLLCGINDMTSELPSPDGVTLRVTVTVISSGEVVGERDIDTTNARDLGTLGSQRTKQLRARYASAPAPVGKPALRLVGGER